MLSDDKNRKCDISQVFRGPCGGPISFLDYEDGDIVFQQQYTEEAADNLMKSLRPECYVQAVVKGEQKQNDKAAVEERIFIIAQAFYGNRTGTYLKPSGLARFIWGCLRNEEPNEQFWEGRKIVPLPGSENLVIIYNERQEERVRMDRGNMQRNSGKNMAEIIHRSRERSFLS